MNTSDEAPIRCLSCGSTQVHAEKRGWNIATGWLGSSNIKVTCLKCGKSQRPGQTISPASQRVFFLFVMGVAFFVWLVTHH